MERIYDSLKALIVFSLIAFGTTVFADTGLAREFTTNKGYGFITPDNQSKGDVLVHISEVDKAGYTALKPGQCVSYYVGTSREDREVN